MKLSVREREELIWLAMKEDGFSTKRLAQEVGLAESTMRRRLARGRRTRDRRSLPTFAILWPSGQFLPSSGCGHKEPIPTGALLYCPVCDKTGCDHWGDLQPFPQIALDKRVADHPKPTRKQRRAKKRGKP